ncbi:MAG: T9SS type A sorting domain-containing protein [Chitinophagaceae bacterium]
MRILILPLVIVLLCCSVSGFSQATCATAIPISGCVSQSIATGANLNAVAGCNATTGKKAIWFTYTTGTNCTALSINGATTAGAGVATEVVAYTDCAASATPANYIVNSSGCFTGGSGVWSPKPGVLAANTTYILRVWVNSTTGTVNICDLNSSASALDITGGCNSYNITNSTGSNGLPLGTCSTGGLKDVTWFKFTSDGTCPLLSIDNSFSNPAGGSTVGNEVSLFSTCGSANSAALTAVNTSCTTNGSSVWSPGTTLVNGNTYYLRVWTNSAAAGGKLNICNIQNVAQSVTLDQNPNTIDVNTSASGGTVSSIASCTGSGSIANGNRAITWVKFTITAAMGTNPCVTFALTQDDPALGMEMALYPSTCGATVQAGTSICFNDGKGIWSAGPSYAGYAPGDYYLRVFSDVAAGTNGKQFVLNGTATTQSANDLCSTAGSFGYALSKASNACAHFTSGTEGLLNNTTDPAKMCAFSLQNTVWYKFIVQQGGVIAKVTVSNIDCDSYNNSSQLLQMGLLKGTCGSLTAAGNAPAASGSPSAFPTTNSAASPTSCLATNSTSAVDLYTNTSVTAGQVIYFAIDGYSGANCKFVLQASQNIIPIPIELKYFTAWKMKTTNLIMWVTAWEHDNSYFEVERSLDGTNFESIGRVAGRTESRTDETYELEDKFPPAVAYYRLKQVDIDGKFSYGNIVQLIRDENIQFSVTAMPNPVQNTARIAISTSDAGNVVLRVIDATGKQLLTDVVSCVKGNNVIAKDFSRLPSGTYYIAISQDGKKAVKTFVKQ